MSVSRPGRAYVAPREPGGRPWTGDAGCAPGLSIFVSPHWPHPVPASNRTYGFVTYAVEPRRRRPRPHGSEECDRGLTVGGPDTGWPDSGGRPSYLRWPARPGQMTSASGTAVVAGWDGR